MAQVCNASTQEVEAGGSRIGGQIWLYNETMSQNGGAGQGPEGKGRKGANTQAPSPAESGAQNRWGLASQGFVTLTELRNQNSSLLSC